MKPLEAITKLGHILSNVNTEVRRNSRLVSFYIKTVIVGLALTGLSYTFFPKLVICLTWFGSNACDPLGNYVVAIASFPGYVFASILLFIKSDVSGQVLVIITFSISILVYYLLSKAIEITRKRGTKIGKIQVMVVAVFILLSMTLLLMV